MKPLVFDLFCGLGGWSEAFIAEGYQAIGFDIEAHDYGSGGYPGQLVIRDVRSLNGAELVREFGVPNCIVASPPCQEYSYMAMPWSKAKEKQRKIESDPAEQKRLTDLFNQCFRIQREVSEAAGRYVPMVVENVRGAQKWVGKARWNFGSFYLWGDVPALMPIPSRAHKCASGTSKRLPGANGGKVSGWPHKLDDNDDSETTLGSPNQILKGEGNKTAGMNWSDQSKRGQDFTRIAGRQSGVKAGPAYRGDCSGWGVAQFTSSKSSARKRASAEIAKIPPALALWIARCFKTHQLK